MGTTFESVKSRSRSRSSVNPIPRAAWGVIAVALLALGASLVYIQIQPAEPNLAILPTLEAAKATATPAGAMPAAPAPTAARRAER